MRREAELRQARAEELSEISEDEAQRARQQRTAAERTARQAQDVDPHAEPLGDDFDIEDVLAGDAKRAEDQRSESLPENAPGERKDTSPT